MLYTDNVLNNFLDLGNDSVPEIQGCRTGQVPPKIWKQLDPPVVLNQVNVRKLIYNPSGWYVLGRFQNPSLVRLQNSLAPRIKISFTTKGIKGACLVMPPQPGDW